MENIKLTRLYLFASALILSLLLIPAVSDAEELSEEGIIVRAVELIDSGDYKEAEDLLLRLNTGKAYFLLGRLYKEQGIFDKAVLYLNRAADSYPLLRDYALRLLAEVYLTNRDFDKAVQTARRINLASLLREAKQLEITALLESKRKADALKVLQQYTAAYPEDQDSRMIMAVLLREGGKEAEAIQILKDIYIGAGPLSVDALRELKAMGADTFTQEELIRRADNLFKNGDFSGAEKVYSELLRTADEQVRQKVMFGLGMCQFRQRRYKEASKSLEAVKGPEALYQRAIAIYRTGDVEGFERLIEEFRKEYPKDTRLADLLLVLANEARQLQRAEDALWGLAWIRYSGGDYKGALRYLSELSDRSKGRNRFKYIYWKGRSIERLRHYGGEEVPDPAEVYNTLLEDTGYYGYLVRVRTRTDTIPKVELPKPSVPKGKAYERIEALRLLNMRADAVREIDLALKEANTTEELVYLGYALMALGEYKKAIAVGERLNGSRFTSLAYPLGYWDVIRYAAEAEGIDPYLVTAIIREESRFDPRAVSRAGAIGLMQLMPSTAYEVNNSLRIGLEDELELYNVEKNILIGVYYISQLMKEFSKLPYALAAYNAGENAVRQWLCRFGHVDVDEFIEDIPYPETRRYVKKVLKSYWQYRAMEGLSLTAYPFISASG